MTVIIYWGTGVLLGRLEWGGWWLVVVPPYHGVLRVEVRGCVVQSRHSGVRAPPRRRAKRRGPARAGPTECRVSHPSQLAPAGTAHPRRRGPIKDLNHTATQKLINLEKVSSENDTSILIVYTAFQSMRRVELDSATGQCVYSACSHHSMFTPQCSRSFRLVLVPQQHRTMNTSNSSQSSTS